MIETTTTTSRLKVTLTGVESSLGYPTVKVSLTHPTIGQVAFESSHFGPYLQGQGIIGEHKGKRICISVSRESFDAAMSEAKAIRTQEIERIKSGKQLISVLWCDGSPLSGWMPADCRGGEVLTELGLAKGIDGWGTLVRDEAVKALGEEFTYAQAVEYLRPETEKKAAAQAAKAAEREEKVAEAHHTGTRVLLRSWSEDCCEKDFDCSHDILTEYVLPDGTTKTERIHTH